MIYVAIGGGVALVIIVIVIIIVVMMHRRKQEAESVIYDLKINVSFLKIKN